MLGSDRAQHRDVGRTPRPENPPEVVRVDRGIGHRFQIEEYVSGHRNDPPRRQEGEER